MSFSHKIRVGVLRGGMSPEYDVSLNTGGTILANMPEEYEPLDIFISKEGAWHTMGLEKNPYDILKTVDVVVNATHGAYGEDGTVQKILENFGIPYTGSDSIASALGMNKVMSKKIFNHYGLKTPQYMIVDKNDSNLADKINENFLLPQNVLIKPLANSSKLMVEEYIDGKEATCGVIEGFRGQNFYTLLPIGNFSEHEKIQIQDASKITHQALGLRHYSSSDFILHPKRGLFALEVNTLPKLSHRSSFIKSLEAVGGNIREFLSHLLSRTLNRK